MRFFTSNFRKGKFRSDAHFRVDFFENSTYRGVTEVNHFIIEFFTKMGVTEVYHIQGYFQKLIIFRRCHSSLQFFVKENFERMLTSQTILLKTSLITVSLRNITSLYNSSQNWVSLWYITSRRILRT